MSEEQTEKKNGRTISIVIFDDGDSQLGLRMEGDVERLSMMQIPASLYSPAEAWAPKLYQACHEMIKNSGQVKQPNRKARRQK